MSASGTPLPPEVLESLQAFLASDEPLHPDRVQAVLPFVLRVH